MKDQLSMHMHQLSALLFQNIFIAELVLKWDLTYFLIMLLSILLWFYILTCLFLAAFILFIFSFQVGISTLTPYAWAFPLSLLLSFIFKPESYFPGPRL